MGGKRAKKGRCGGWERKNKVEVEWVGREQKGERGAESGWEESKKGREVGGKRAKKGKERKKGGGGVSEKRERKGEGRGK